MKKGKKKKSDGCFGAKRRGNIAALEGDLNTFRKHSMRIVSRCGKDVALITFA